MELKITKKGEKRTSNSLTRPTQTSAGWGLKSKIYQPCKAACVFSMGAPHQTNLINHLLAANYRQFGTFLIEHHPRYLFFFLNGDEFPTTQTTSYRARSAEAPKSKGGCCGIEYAGGTKPQQRLEPRLYGTGFWSTRLYKINIINGYLRCFCGSVALTNTKKKRSTKKQPSPSRASHT